MCFTGWGWNIVPKPLACLHILQIKLMSLYKWCRAASVKFNWFEGFIIVLKVRHRIQLAWDSCDSWPNINIVLWCKMFFNELLHMVAHPPHAQSNAPIYKRKWGQINSSSLWSVACVSVYVCQVYGVLPSALQHQFRLLLWEKCQLLWLWGGCSESCSPPTQSQDHHHPHQSRWQSLLLVSGVTQPLGILLFPFLCQLLRVKLQQPFQHFHILFFTSLPTAPKSPWWPSGTEVLFPRRHHRRPWGTSKAAGPPESLPGARLVRHPPGALAQQLPLQPGTAHFENKAFCPSTQVYFYSLLLVPVDTFTVWFSCPAVSLGRTDAEDRTCFCHGQSPEVLELNQHHQLPQDPGVSIILGGLFFFFFVILLGFFVTFTFGF